jgi:hypothetical protein
LVDGEIELDVEDNGEFVEVWRKVSKWQRWSKMTKDDKANTNKIAYDILSISKEKMSIR